MCTMGAQKSGRPMVAPTFIDRNAIGFVGAGNARQTIPQSASLTGLLLVGAFGGLGFMGGRVARVVQLLVAEVDEQVRADGQQIENIHGQHIGDVMGDQLRGDAAEIAEDDEQDEREAHAARRAGAGVVDEGDRP